MLDPEITYTPPTGSKVGLYQIVFPGDPPRTVFRQHESGKLWLDPSVPEQRAVLVDAAIRAWNSCYPDMPLEAPDDPE